MMADENTAYLDYEDVNSGAKDTNHWILYGELERNGSHVIHAAVFRNGCESWR
jgi:hypothetical protein